jgi:DNA-binding PadR family transcriptional regulator
MKSLRNVAGHPTGLALPADEVTELHAGRILLLLRICGTGARIEGLTKLAKLDFFVRYPEFFNRVARTLGRTEQSATKSVESAMIRHHYGPWDKRYYKVLPYLEARGLLTVQKEGSTYVFRLTAKGKEIAGALSEAEEFSELVERMSLVKRVLGSKSGSTLKNLVYQQFDKEVAEKNLGEIIV